MKNDKTHPYLEALLPEGGRIPIHVVVGAGDIWAHARDLAAGLARQHHGVLVTGHEHTENHAGQIVHLTSSGLFKRCRALLQDKSLEVLVVVVDSEELLTTGLPFDARTELHIVGNVEAALHALFVDQV